MIGGIFMDYEIMMNGNVRIGMYAPDFEAQTTMGNINLVIIKVNGLFYFLTLVILLLFAQLK